MASQNTDMVDEVDEAKLAPLGDGEPATGDPLESSPDANVESREVLEIHQDPAASPDPAASRSQAGPIGRWRASNRGSIGIIP
ncbi:hypothetical protein PAL_GLEAN10002870 [Pteropus alecto]|uniref:Uncharacterized protein n=1 Tax=Pteropus alecto TaxID=9402 RepID=L5KKR4_PTEAL|nr:hypothetical protein PAL_GLEAN10002870 [Pteropus alecto]